MMHLNIEWPKLLKDKILPLFVTAVVLIAVSYHQPVPSAVGDGRQPDLLLTFPRRGAPRDFYLAFHLWKSEPPC
jgi:hypothetical protein